MGTDRNITRFQLEVTVKDSGELAKKFDDFQKLIETQMHDSGYIPVLDLGVNVRVTYDPNKEVFNYLLTSHGVFVGKKKSGDYIGIAGDKWIEQPTPQPKSNQS